jgi:hypothetical protein
VEEVVAAIVSLGPASRTSPCCRLALVRLHSTINVGQRSSTRKSPSDMIALDASPHYPRTFQYIYQPRVDTMNHSGMLQFKPHRGQISTTMQLWPTMRLSHPRTRR